MKRLFLPIAVLIGFVCFIAEQSYSQQLLLIEDTIVMNERYNFRQSVRFDPSGNIHMTWTGQIDTDGSTREIFYGTNKTGQLSIVQLTNNNVDNNFASFAIDKSGSLHIIYLEFQPSSQTYQIAYVNNRSGEFSAPIWLTDGFNKASPHMAITSDNRIHLVYQSYHFNDPNLDDHVYYRTYNFITGTAGMEIQLGMSNPSSEKETRIVTDSNNYVHIVYRAGSSWSGPLKYYNNTSGDLVEYDIPVEGNISGPATVMDAEDQLHIIYRHGNAMYYIKRDQNGNFSTPVAATPLNIGIPSFYRSIDVDHEGRLYFMYQNSVATAPRGFFLVHGIDGDFSDPILVSDKFSDGYLILINSSVAARNNGDIVATYAAARAQDGNVVSDIFMKKGNIFSEPEPFISVAPSSLSFEQTPVGSQNEVLLNIRNKGFSDLEITQILFSDDSFFTNVELPLVVDPESDKNIEIVFRPVWQGSFESVMNIKSNAGNLPELTIPLVATANIVLYTLRFEVIDAAGNPVPNAVITLNNSVFPAGQYEFTDLFPGVYDYQVDASGFPPYSGSVVLSDEHLNIVVELDGITRIHAEMAIAGTQIFPNPAQNEINIQSKEYFKLLQIIDPSGKIVFQDSILQQSANISLSNLQPGYYILKLYFQDFIVREKIIVTK